MIKYASLAIACVLAATASKAQNYDEYGRELVVKCHTNEMQDALFLSHPELEDQAAHFAEVLRNELRDFEALGADRTDPYIIPVVFHIVHNFGTENISNAQVEDCIRVMNEDFTGTNAGAATVNAAFADLVADVGVEFRLAKIDPDGNCTNGIVRTVSPLTAEGGENLKVISPIWNRSKYMNVWVCRTIASGAAGYTYYPSSLAGAFGLTNDGIVVRSDYVGAIGTSSPNRSHTMTHEVGHWINLAHVWGSTNQPGVDENCDSDDEVGDTPNTLGWTSCNANGHSCGSLDNVENYMDYAFCMKMFTLGQKDRMIASLNSNVASRSSLWQDQNLIDTGVLEESVPCLVEFAADRTTICAGESITFTDESFNNISSRTWIFQGGNPGLSSETNPVVTFNQPGVYAVSIAVSDGNTLLTEVKPNFIRVLGPGEQNLPFSEGFEDFAAFNISNDDFWFTEQLPVGQGWALSQEASYSGAKAAYVPGYGNPLGSSTKLVSRHFDLSGVSGPIEVSFKYAHANRSSESYDKLIVYAKRSCDTPWSVRRILEGNALPTVEGNYFSPYVPISQEEWQEEVISNLVPSFYTDEFRLMFEFISDNGNNIYIDDINIIDNGLPLSAQSESLDFMDLAVWPNPSTGQLYFSFEATGFEGFTTIDLFDLSGRHVAGLFAGRLNAGRQDINTALNGLNAGVYLARMQTENGTQRTVRIMLDPAR